GSAGACAGRRDDSGSRARTTGAGEGHHAALLRSRRTEAAGMKRSALFHHHRHAGARFADYHGWELPSGFSNPETEAAHVREFVGLAELSYRATFETASAPPRNGGRLTQDRY